MREVTSILYRVIVIPEVYYVNYEDMKNLKLVY